MDADTLSALGSAAAAFIALIALVVAVFAAVSAKRSADEAKRSADSAEKQTEIAARTFKASVTPRIGFELGGRHRTPSSFDYTLSITRTGGPTVMYLKCEQSSDLVLDSGDVNERQSTSREAGRWEAIYESEPVPFHRMVRIEKGRRVKYLKVRVKVEVSASDDGGKPEDNLVLERDIYTEPSR